MNVLHAAGLIVSPPDAIPDVASTLFQLHLKSVVMLALVALGCCLLSRASASLRHLIWTVGVTGTLALLITIPAFHSTGTAWRAPLPFDLVPPAWMTGPRIRPEGPERAALPVPVSEVSSTEGDSRRIGAAAPRSEPLAKPSIPTAGWIIGVWAAGALFFLARIGLGVAGLEGIRRAGAPLEDRAWLRTRDALCEKYGLARRPRLFTSPGVATSMTWGALKPSITLPDESSDWSEDQRRMVLAHELAHVKRRDVAWNSLATLACAIQWTNPLAWLAARRMRAEAELACDDIVLTAGVDRVGYARCLLAAAHLLRERRSRPGVAIGMASGSTLEGRLRAIFDRHRRRSSVSRAARAVAFSVGLGSTLVLAMYQAAVSPRHAIAQSPPASAPGSHSLAEGRRAEIDRWPTSSAMDPIATREALARLRNGSGKVRLEAAARLGNVGTTEAVPDLIQALGDEDERLRSAAASALGHVRDRRAVEPLLGALADPDEHVQQAAVGALGELRDESATLPLAGLLGSPSEHIRQSAASALGDAGDERATSFLIAALADPNKHVRQSAALSLGRLGSARAAPALATLLDDESPHVRAAAIRALGQIGASRYAERLAALYDRSTNQFVRLEAGRSLGQFGDLRGLGLLAGTLREEPEQFIRCDAAWAIAAIAATSEALRLEVLRAPHGVEAALQEAQRDESRFVRHAAALAYELVTGTDSRGSRPGGKTPE